MNISRAVLALLIVGSIPLGCSDTTPSEPGEPTVAGTWEGLSQGLTLRLVLEVSGEDAISGTGSLFTGSTTRSLTVTEGTYADPHVTIQMVDQINTQFNFEGALEWDDRLRGTLHDGMETHEFEMQRL